MDITDYLDHQPIQPLTGFIPSHRSHVEQQQLWVWLYRLLSADRFRFNYPWHTSLEILHQSLGLSLEHLSTISPADQNSIIGMRFVAAVVAESISGPTACGESELQAQISRIADAAALSAIDRSVLRLLAMEKIDHEFTRALECLGISLRNLSRHQNRLAVCVMLDITPEQLSLSVSLQGALKKTGLLSIDDDGDAQLTPVVLRYIQQHDGTLPFVDYVVGAPKTSVCIPSDFAHLGDAVAQIGEVLKSAVIQKAKGINIFLYGPSGSGKTELAAVITASIGCALHGICESPDRGEAPHRSERIQTMILCQHMLSGRGNSVLVMDEADDVLSENWSFLKMLKKSATSSYSKIFLTRMLEQNSLPVIWIVNDIEGVDPALLRRMSFALKVPVPTPCVRAQVWEKALSSAGITSTIDQIKRLASDLQTGPAVAASAIRVAKLQGGDFEAMTTAAYSIASAMQGGTRVRRKQPHETFDIQLVSCGKDFQALHERATAWRDTSVSFCISGPSGTGKSLGLRALANQMGLEIMTCRASTLLGRYVGETEANIAEAFSRAETDGLFLVIDEAETLLGDRQRADRNWEASRTAEFLTCMEAHPLPFGVTTNHLDQIDSAMLRRFTFKLRFETMEPAKLARAFELFFKMSPPALLHTMQGLTAGDFAVVAKRARLMGFGDDATRCVRALADECIAKTPKSRPVGFLAPSAYFHAIPRQSDRH